jgi:hypothetical protein
LIEPATFDSVLSTSSTDLGGIISAVLYSAAYRFKAVKINSKNAQNVTSLKGISGDIWCPEY